jgi:tetratricopeptide (TPR) repeat protein
MRRTILQLFAVALLTLPSVAVSAKGAQPRTPRQTEVQAYVQTEEGLKLYEARRWQEAFDKLRRAEELRHSPTRVLYMARCQYKLGKLIEARALYERVLGEKLPRNAPSNLLDQREEAKKELEIVRVRTPRVKLVLSGIPANESRVFVNGVRIVAWDKEIELNPGQHTIEVTSAGAEPLLRTFTVNEGRSKTVTLVRTARAAQARSRM